MNTRARGAAWIGVMLAAGICGADGDRVIVPPMGIGLSGVSSYGSTWHFVDMMKHSREWRTRQDWDRWTIVEDESGWPVSLKHKDGTTASIDGDHPIFMYSYYRRIEGDVVLAWEGDGDVSLGGQKITLKEDNVPQRNRRVYTFAANDNGVFDLNVSRSNPADPVHNIRMWMPGFENSSETFHPLWKQIIAPFPYFRFMDWGATNGSRQKEWADRTTVRHMRQTNGVAYEYMIRLCNEMKKDAWICVPHMASDDYVRQLGRLIKEQLDPGLRVYVEYSNEIWNPAFTQTHWLWDRAEEEIKAQGLTDAQGKPRLKWEHGATLCGRRSAQIWKVLAGEFGDPDRLVRVVACFRWLDNVMAGALDRSFGDGRVDLIALNGYFISQDSLEYALRDLDHWDAGEAFEVLEQQHLLGGAMGWRHEMAGVRRQWPGIPITCYEGGQHFANPFASGLQGEALVARMMDVNADRRIKDIYRTALETWHLAGGEGFTAFVECGPWGKYGCWGHRQYVTQPLDDVVDPATGEIKERGAHKFKALLDYMERRRGQDPRHAPRITTAALADAALGKPYAMQLAAEGGTPPYTWSLLGGRLPDGLTVESGGTIRGTPTCVEQLACLVDCTDGRNQHAAAILGLFMDPTGGVDMQAGVFTNGLPAGWAFLQGKGAVKTVSDPAGGPVAQIAGDIAFLPGCALGAGQDADYTAEVVFTCPAGLNRHHRLGLAFCLSPDGDPEDFLRVAIDGLGQRAFVCSRYVAGGRGELWGPRECRLLPDEGEAETDPALDPGEYWTIRATVRPGASPGAIDLLICVLDQDGKPRLDSAGRTDVANGIYLLRELALKDALRRGPFGLLMSSGLVKQVRWSGAPAPAAGRRLVRERQPSREGSPHEEVDRVVCDIRFAC